MVMAMAPLRGLISWVWCHCGSGSCPGCGCSAASVLFVVNDALPLGTFIIFGNKLVFFFFKFNTFNLSANKTLPKQVSFN